MGDIAMAQVVKLVDKTEDSGLVQVLMSAHFLDLLLRHRMEIFEVSSREFEPSFALGESVVPNCRLIFVEEGCLAYEIEGSRRFQCGKNTQLFIPAWLKRSWRVSGKSPLKLHWISFTLPFFDEALASERVGIAADPAEELAVQRRASRAWPEHPVADPMIESELKTALVRFFLANPARIEETGPPEARERVSSGVFEVRRIVRWLEEQYRDPAALTRVAHEVTINKDYFRRLFVRETGATLGGYIGRLRMLAARYLLRETSLRIQEVAARVGCTDQRYFARQYRRFWKCAPSEERSAS